MFGLNPKGCCPHKKAQCWQDYVMEMYFSVSGCGKLVKLEAFIKKTEYEGFRGKPKADNTET